MTLEFFEQAQELRDEIEDLGKTRRFIEDVIQNFDNYLTNGDLTLVIRYPHEEYEEDYNPKIEIPVTIDAIPYFEKLIARNKELEDHLEHEFESL